jgi:hypothetical protein
MKVLFLDIDGVINTVGGELGIRYCTDTFPERKDGSEFFDPACLWYLRDIITKTECKIVVSSAWRLGVSLDEMKAWFRCEVIRASIIGKTPSFNAKSHPHLVDRSGRVQRGEEILAWLDSNPEVTKYAVLDDDGDMDAVRRNFFQTETHDGLKREVAYDVIAHLNHENYLDHYRVNHALNKYLKELYTCLGDLPSHSKTQDEIIRLTSSLVEEYYTKNPSNVRARRV